VAGLTSRSYAAKLREQILSGKPGQAVRAGDPVPYESSQTTHYSVVDTEGTAVSNTYTLNDGYGSGVTVEGAGFLLNDQMDDFAAKPGSPNMFGLVQGEANSIAPHKRPLSSMTPTIVLQEDTDHSAGPSGVVDSSVHDRQRSRVAPPGTAQGPGTPRASQRVRLVLGSPGGGTITNTVLQVLLNVLVFRMDVRQAVTAPRFHDQWLPDKLVVESWGFSADTLKMLKDSGYQLMTRASIGECEAIEVDPKSGWKFGAADPRGDGKAVGY
jgi:gamma-glutamyltranspeptidase/glutathione hydrolase